MKLERPVWRKLIQDGIISLFLYALPVLLMFLYFCMRGEHPWRQQEGKGIITISK
ncbi:MAG TPA: hypothetical protein VM802_14670 [Chitinophaga sp.]|uniref:hypothetical protein n=1 Tax=Chitinophaga sp. TaxID=1869181 RepID=UPI002CF7FCB1|nr:hypothetical protein [Chitinophaga sp.]HVI46116.1 hypothetical protein [Chitinophaga sp.]